jgi:hypothetical protein
VLLVALPPVTTLVNAQAVDKVRTLHNNDTITVGGRNLKFSYGEFARPARQRESTAALQEMWAL